MKDQKRSYSNPQVEIVSLITEHGIAASSVMVSGGLNGNQYQPTVEDWEVGGNGSWITDL
ncbi:hypothetical protein [Sphingobacterium corticibacter]|uniref:Uncharacterized protein n=1 Tax=Sphingobacterium corticibacter TaxID=2171749 RepID=A0A2T8HK71_9SPHI|nr:hypothetical protein [Sphingobacterium corticibacter]PVH25844.1 hypothetical protein DC487_07895 [Sphingobacterium corticibacter]